MLTRIITSVIGLFVFFLIVLSDAIVAEIAIFLLTAGMLYELYSALKCKRKVFLLGILSFLVLIFGEKIAAGFGSAIFILLFLIFTVAEHGKINHKEIFTTAFITYYTVVLMNYIGRTRVDFGVCAMILIFVCAWMTDTGAYFSGVFLGKHKLIPRVSPKKTIEGSVGGIIITTLSAMLYLFIISKIGNNIPGISFDLAGYAKMAAIGFIAGILTQFGDLAASAIKRDCDIKDFGHIFPGHGGLMDRFDSVIFIAPVIYYFISFLQ